MWRPWVEFNHSSSYSSPPEMRELDSQEDQSTLDDHRTVNCLFYQVRSEGLQLSEGVLGPLLSTPTCVLQLSVKAPGASM